MAASTGTVGYNASLVASGGPTIAQLTRVSFPGSSISDIDITNMDSDDAAMEFLPGLIDGGTVDVEAVHNTSTHNAVESEFTARTRRTWTITLSDTHTLAFTGYMNALSGDDNINEGVTMSMSLKVSGLITYT